MDVTKKIRGSACDNNSGSTTPQIPRDNGRTRDKLTELQVRLIVRSQAGNLGTTPFSGLGISTMCQRPRLELTRTTNALRGGGPSGRI
jgi:hypothetical protein